MHRFVICLVIASVGACASSPPGSGPGEIEKLIESLSYENPWSGKYGNRLIEIGDPAVPALAKRVQDPSTSIDRRLSIAWVLGRIWTRTGNPEALDAYVQGVRKELAGEDSRARKLLELAHQFRDPEG